jgi:hypothetical protein
MSKNITLFPLWFYTANKDSNASKTNFYLPTIYSFKSVNESKFSIFPIVFSNTNPFKKSFLIFPLYYREVSKEFNATNKLSMLTPLIWISKDSSNYNKKVIRILPLFWHKEYSSGAYTKTSNTLFPIYFDVNKYKNNNLYAQKRIIFPIYWRYKNETNKSITVLPIFHFNKSFKEQNLAITPLFWNINNAKKNQNLLWPLYNYNRFKNDSNTRFNIAYILYRYQKTDKIKAWNMAWPLVQHIKGNNYSYFHAAPIIWYKKSDSMNYFSIQPLFFSQKTNEFKRFQLLWQLYSYRNIFNTKTTHSFLWRAFYNTQYTNGDYENRLLYKVYVNNKKDSSTEKTLLPLYSIEKQKNGDYYKGYFLSIYQKTKTQIPNTNHYYLEEKIFWFLRLRSNFNYLKQNGIVTDRKSLMK